MSQDSHLLLLPGTYVVAVSGGVDSVVLLDLLVEHNKDQHGVKLVVAHVDHGMRSDSGSDADFVKNLAAAYGLIYETTSLNLGVGTSEATARDARYGFLRHVQQAYGAVAVITAHHQDDLIETSMINLLRGTGRHGLTSLKSTDNLIRPLLKASKNQLMQQAQAKGLKWHEDSTNLDLTYTRNKIRHNVVANMTIEQREQWIKHLQRAELFNSKLDSEISGLLRRGLHKGKAILSRSWFRQLPHPIAREVVVAMLRSSGVRELDRKTVERIVVAIKVLPHGKIVQASGVTVRLSKRSAHFVSVVQSSDAAKNTV